MPILEKVRWAGVEDKTRFATWAHTQLSNTMGDRAALEAKWADYIVQWRAALPKGTKDFPWPGASNLVFPLTAMHSDPVYADFMQTLHAAEEYWTTTAHRPDRVKHAMPFTEFMKGVEKRFIKMRTVNSRALLDNNILGTAIYKAHWLHERKKVRDYAGDVGARTIEEVVKVRSHPLIEHIPLQHFWIPADAWDIDPDAPIGGAQWVAQELYFTRAQFVARAESESPFVPAFDRDAVAMVIAFESSREVPLDDTIRKQEEYIPWDERRIRLFEVWARYDVDGDGIEEDIVAIVHRESNVVLRALYNPFLHGKRPFFRTRYLPTFGFYGLGLGEADRWAQLTVTKLLNAQIDNVTLANTRMYSAPLGSGIQAGEAVYPGKIWFVGPDEAIGEVRLGEIYPSLPGTIQSMMQYSEMRTAVSELRQGNLTGLPSRTPATSLLSILREGNKRFDMILSDFREVHGRMGEMTAQNLAQWYQEDPFPWEQYCRTLLGDDDAALVLQVLGESVHSLPDSLGVTVNATSGMVNKEVEKQSFIGLLQITADIYSKLIQTAQLLQTLPPGTPTYETAAAAYRSGVELLQQLLQRFDIQNPSEYIGNLDIIANTLSAQQQGMNPAMAQGLMPQPQLPPGMGMPMDPSLVAPMMGFGA